MVKTAKFKKSLSYSSVRFLFLTGVVFAFYSCFLDSVYIDPKVTVSRFEIKEVTRENITGEVWLNIHNGNNYSYSLKLDNCLVALNGIKIGELFVAEYTELLAQNSVDVPVKVIIPKSSLISGIVSGILSSFLAGNQTEVIITIQGTIVIKKFSIPVKKSFEINYPVDALSKLRDGLKAPL